MNQEIESILTGIFIKVLNLQPNSDLSSVEYQVHPHWDSIRHVELFIKISNKFLISFNAEDVVSLKTYAAITQAVQTKLKK